MVLGIYDGQLHVSAGFDYFVWKSILLGIRTVTPTSYPAPICLGYIFLSFQSAIYSRRYDIGLA